MSIGINHVVEESYREIIFDSPVVCDNRGIANTPEPCTVRYMTEQQLLEKYGSGKDILAALAIAPTVLAKNDPNYNPELPDRMVVIKG
jgi:hypothetical protein